MANSQTPFSQNIIAIMWDFDKTLTPKYMQEPLFNKYGVDPNVFWKELDTLVESYGSSINNKAMVSRDAAILNLILRYVRDGRFKGLSNKVLRELGSQIEFYDGLPEYMKFLKEGVKEDPSYAKFDLTVEHYVVSTGLRQMMLGSKIAEYVEEIWGSEFIEDETSTICEIGYLLDHTTKTRAIFEINKGINKDPDIDVNQPMDDKDRRVPFQNMIYIADGPSDVPAFSIVKKNGGWTYAVYAPYSEEEFDQAKSLQDHGRVNGFGEAKYTSTSHTYMWIMTQICEIANRIVQDKKAYLAAKGGSPPKHLK